MKVKIANPDTAAGLVDPQSRRRPFLDGEGKPITGVVDVPDSNYWQRRVIDKSVVLADGGGERATPTGAEPIAPLTTRKGS